MENCEDKKPWFEPTVILTNDQPAGFKAWCEKITCEKYIATLPDTSNINVRMFIDFQGVFNNGSYTNYLLNRYKELYG